MKNAPGTESRKQLLPLLAIAFLLSCTNVPTAISSDAVARTSGVTTTSDMAKSPELIAHTRKNSELAQKLRTKYDFEKDNLSIELEHTQYGPKGHINLMGKRVSEGKQESKNMVESQEAILAKTKSVALAFLENEPDLFGTIKSADFRIIREEIGRHGITYIRVQRVIEDIPLENSMIQIDVAANGRITWVNADLIPPPPELYEAAKKETLPEARIREIAEDALRGMGFDANTDPSIRKHMKVGKIAITTPPYVLWKVASTWTILIDAFTGEVLEKYSNIRR